MYQPAGYYKDEDNIGIIFDSGCTTTITPYTSDFEGQITSVKKTITGLGSTSEVVGEGTVRRTFRNNYGCAQNIKVKVYHVPTSNLRLFSPQSYFAHEKRVVSYDNGWNHVYIWVR